MFRPSQLVFKRPGGELCQSCADIARSNERTRARRQARMEAMAEAATRRAACITLASPVWRDRAAIAAIYREARRLTAETGEQHEVDHFYPIQGKSCCGLHVAANLRVVSMTKNRRKGNSMPAELTNSGPNCYLFGQGDDLRPEPETAAGRFNIAIARPSPNQHKMR